MSTPDTSPQLPDPARVLFSDFYGSPKEAQAHVTGVEVDILGIDTGIFLAMRTAFRANGLHGATESPSGNTTDTPAVPYHEYFHTPPVELPEPPQSQ